MNGAKKRLLVIVNPYATTVSDRLKNLVVYALQGRFEVEVEATESQDHATEIGRDAQDGQSPPQALGPDFTPVERPAPDRARERGVGHVPAEFRKRTDRDVRDSIVEPVEEVLDKREA